MDGAVELFLTEDWLRRKADSGTDPCSAGRSRHVVGTGAEWGTGRCCWDPGAVGPGVGKMQAPVTLALVPVP